MKIITLIILTTICTAIQSFAGGIIFYTNMGSSYVNVVQYSSFTSTNAHLAYITTNDGKRIKIFTAGIIANIPFPNNASKYSMDEIQSYIAQAELMSAQQPKYAEAMRKVTDLWNAQITINESRERAKKMEKERQIAEETRKRLEEEKINAEKAEEERRLEEERTKIAKAEEERRLEEERTKVAKAEEERRLEEERLNAAKAEEVEREKFLEESAGSLKAIEDLLKSLIKQPPIHAEQERKLLHINNL